MRLVLELHGLEYCVWYLSLVNSNTNLYWKIYEPCSLLFFFFYRKKQGVGLGWYPIFYKFSLFSFQILPFLHDLVLNVMLVWYWFGFVRHLGKLGRWLVLLQIAFMWFLQIRTIILSQLPSQVLANHILQWRWVLSMHASIGTIMLSQLYYWFLTDLILYWSWVLFKHA